MPPARPKVLKLATLRVHRQPGSVTRGWLVAGPVRIPCVLGRSGFTHRKREGDGATPVARMRLLELRYRADRMARPPTSLPTRIIRPEDGWCDDASSGRYNCPVRRPFTGSHEEMLRVDRLYDVVIVMDWNISRRAAGRGSAIFFHLTRPDLGPTAGCVAIDPVHMRRLLPMLSRRAAMITG